MSCGNKAPRIMPAIMCERIINLAERTDSPLFQQCPKEIMAASHPDFRDLKRTVRKHLQSHPAPTHHTALFSYSSHGQVPVNEDKRLPPAASLGDTCPWMSCSHLRVTNSNWNSPFSQAEPASLSVVHFVGLFNTILLFVSSRNFVHCANQ